MAYTRTPHERLMSRVVQHPDGCWEWSGPTVGGYSRVGNVPGATPKNVYGHIVSYEHHVGEVPEGMFVLHSCDNRRCVNPDHLRTGTRQDNMNDKVERDRQVRGERQVHAKLTAPMVLEIRERHAVGDVTLTSLAQEFDVDVASIHNIVKRKTWKHI